MSKGKQAAVCEDENNGAQAEEINDSARATGTGAVLIKIGGHIVYCLTIIGQIEGHSILPNDS